MADVCHRFFNPARLAVMALITSLLAPAALAAESDAEEQIRERLGASVPGVRVESVEKTEVEGFYQVKTDQDLIYVSGDGQHVLLGEILRLGDDGNIVNLTEEARSSDRKAAIEAVPQEDMIRFVPEGEVKAVMYVFTDIDCGYCRRMHAEVDGYNELGIQINYLAFPRAGQGSSAYNKAVSAWCADDPNEAITLAKEGKRIPEKTCDNPVGEQFRLGQNIGVSGTPATVMENGRLVPGFRPPAAMAEVLGIE